MSDPAVLIMPAIGMPGPLEMAFIVLLVVMFFGLGKLPKVGNQLAEVGRTLGDSIRAFREGQRAPPIDVTENSEELQQPPAAEPEAQPSAEEAETL